MQLGAREINVQTAWGKLSTSFMFECMQIYKTIDC